MDDGKTKALREHGTLNPRPDRVGDSLFQNSEFFDPRDLVLVKYEMLRRVLVEGQSVAQAARNFGFSRVTFYQTHLSFKKEGLPGLVPRRRGPHEAHKLSATILDFIDRQRAQDPSLHARQLVGLVQGQFGLSVHPRSIERALSRRRKKGRQKSRK